MNYAERLNQTKSNYPFKRWAENAQFAPNVYSSENCDEITKIFDDLIADLISKGEGASKSENVESFRIAIEATNKFNDKFNGCFIETGEREELCELTDIITVAAGLDPENYGEGEGLASEWREW
ncbi:MAG TPA: hypothetical protein VF596_09610 [Pyrinomonadaceae bacterium]|jgi:hypothetical protein